MRLSPILLLALSTPAAADWFRLDVTVTTTSDWTAVRFANAARFWVDSQKVAAEDPAVKVETGPLRIGKPSMNATKTTLEAVVFVELPEKGDLEIIVTRGDIGGTRVAIKDVVEFVHDTKTGEPTNRKAFTASAEKIRRLGAARFEVKKPREKLVLAFYYPWYGTKVGPSGRWVHWDPERHNAATNTPELGLYDSNDEAVLRKHIEWAKAAGVDGFIASWWGEGTFEDRALRNLLAVAEKEKFLVGAYYEQAKDAKQIAADFAYLDREYGPSPAWLRSDGAPVVFVYTRVAAAFPPADFVAARGKALLLMDTPDLDLARAGGGLHSYNPVFTDLEPLRSEYQSASFASRVNGLLFAATVVPGYDDTFVRTPGGRRARDGGKLYDAFWEAAIASEPDWILVCSWNEWHEGSEIEPSKEDGDLYLKKTAEWVKKWKGK
ncbi:MAG: hypothetical protein HYY18_20240 [Planctomycetes bacterium]|nr:hypothetical protein [Planctomycetota bacterium]